MFQRIFLLKFIYLCFVLHLSSSIENRFKNSTFNVKKNTTSNGFIPTKDPEKLLSSNSLQSTIQSKLVPNADKRSSETVQVAKTVDSTYENFLNEYQHQHISTGTNYALNSENGILKVNNDIKARDGLGLQNYASTGYDGKPFYYKQAGYTLNDHGSYKYPTADYHLHEHYIKNEDHRNNYEVAYHTGYGHHKGGFYESVFLGKALALKTVLIPIAGVALLGAAAALVSNPILLQLGIVSGKKKRRRRQIHNYLNDQNPYELLNDEYNQIGK